MSKAFIDSTVLTDALLKTGQIKQNAEDALKRYEITELPVYAIKEFKAGPLSNFAWMHNKLATTQSYSKALDALHRMSRTPKRYTTSTAIEALRDASSDSIGKQTPEKLAEKYGKDAGMDKILCDEFRLAIRTKIAMAWKKRRKVTTKVVLPLPCYREGSPYEERGQLITKPTRCLKTEDCYLAEELKKKPNELKILKQVIEKLPEKLENKKRAKILRKLYRTPKQPASDSDCKALGDAIYAIFAPQDSIILTTNIKDHKPLASALGKEVENP